MAHMLTRFTLNYRSMCRFFSGFFWRHPAITQYEWIWRLDTDIEFHCDVVCISALFPCLSITQLCQPYDPIVRMRSANALYG